MAAKTITMDNLKKNPRTTKTKVEDVTAPSVVEKDPPKAKKKTGRPKVKMGEYKTINISVPVETLAKMEVAKVKYGNNLTAYVNAVIKADLDANYERYEELQKLLNS